MSVGDRGESLLRAAALVILLAGAVASFIYMRRTGHDAPLPLFLMFTVWVLAPFGALGAAVFAAGRWTGQVRSALHIVILAIAAGSPVLYAHPPTYKPASLFLILPLVSFLLIAIVVAAGRLSRVESSR